MSAVSAVLLETINELQALVTLTPAVLGGGTSLALRYNHRESDDIDLFFDGIIGRKGFEAIEKEVREKFGAAILGLEYPCDINDQYVFMRFFVRKGNHQIKVDIMQNMCFMDESESIQGVRVLTESDIGLMKLMAACNRSSFKDIYDLHYLTEKIALGDLIKRLEEKENLHCHEEDKNIFALDNEESPVANPSLLLKFDEETQAKEGRPAHSRLRFEIIDGVSWQGAKAVWRRKVRDLFRSLNLEFPRH